MKKKIFWPLLILTIAIASLFFMRFPSAEIEPTSLANPASTYCLEQGGDLKIETRPDGGEFGVCYFMDNYQCEEWTMLRGECPVGGLKVTGYITPAGRFCAISGGTYKITVQGNVETEKGTCALFDGEVCEAEGFWDGSCPTAE